MSFGKPDARRRFEECKEERREERREFDGFGGTRSVGSRHSGHDDSGVGADPEVGGVLVRDLHDELKLGQLQVRGIDLEWVLRCQRLVAEERTRPVANGGTKSRLWWMCAEGLARKP